MQRLDRVDSRIFPLLHAFVARRSAVGYKPGLLCRLMKSEGAWCDPEWPEKVQEMGWAFHALDEWKQIVLWNYSMLGGGQWETFMRNTGVSKKDFNSILLDLQDAAATRGLLPEEPEDRMGDG